MDGVRFERHVAHRLIERVTLSLKQVRIELRSSEPDDDGQRHNEQLVSDDNIDCSDEQSQQAPTILVVPWAPAPSQARKGVAFEPAGARAKLPPHARDAILLAIAKARGWIDDLTTGRAASFDEFAIRENKGERHIRLLAPLAFTSPRMIQAIIDGRAPGDLTVTSLVRSLPHAWADQEAALRV